MTKTTLRTLMMTGAAVLALSACKDKDSASASAANIDVPGISSAEMDKHFSVAETKVDEASATAALAELKLDTPSDQFSWGSKDGVDGTYTYSDVKLMSDDNDVTTIDTLTLVNVSQGANGADLDKMVAEGITIAAASGDMGELTIESITVVEPNMDEVRSFLASEGDSTSIPSADAFSLVGMKGRIDDEEAKGTIEVAKIAFAQPTSADSRDGFAVMDNISVDIAGEENGEPMALKMSLDSLSASGIADAGIFMGDMSGLASMSSMNNPASLPFKSVSLDDFDMSMDTLTIDMPSIQAVYEEKGDRITGRSVMKPMTIGFSGPPNVSDLNELYEGLQQIGYSEIVLSAGGDSEIDLKADTMAASNTFFEMKDGFRMEMDYELSGVKEMMAAQKAAIADLGPAPGPDAESWEQQAYSQQLLGVSMTGMDSMSLIDSVIRFDDNGVVDKAFEAVAAQQGTSAKNLRMQTKGLLAMGTMMAQGSGVDTELVSEMIAAAGEFIDNPGSALVIKVKPGSATPLMQLPTLDKAGMGFSASVDK